MNKLINAILHPRRAFAVTLDIVESRLLPSQSQSKVSVDAKKLWGSSVSDIYVQDISHWSGKGRWADEQSWNQIGQKHLKMFKELCLLSAVTKPINSMIEWGPGGGANAIWFCTEVTDFYGIDISKANLGECQHQLEIRNFKRFHPVLIDIEKPGECLNHINSHVDFFISTAVYQHFPSKQYGIHITELAHRLLTDNGIAIIQIRYDTRL